MPDRFFYPRPEYPRPERQRGTIEGEDWINLNGPWQFRFDGDRKGEQERWFEPDNLEWREQIILPFCWESLAAWGEGDTAGNDNFYSARVFRNPLEVTRANHRSALRYEVGWYRREIRVPDNPAWRGKRIILTIGAADFFTDCWCNGIHLGRHEGGYTPFEFDLTDALEVGAATRGLVVIRVEDPMNNSEQPVGKQWRWYTTTSGIWQTVFLEPRDAAHIGSFRVIPDIDRGIARFEVKCVDAPEQSLVELEIAAPDGTSQRESLQVKGNEAQGEVKLSRLALWDPNAPNLYQLIVRLSVDGTARDTVRSYFGMRKIDFEYTKNSGAPAALRLNNVARYLRGALYQSYHPDGVYTAGSVETLKNDIAYAKKFGFNFLRVHIKVDDPLLLYWADTLGILLMQDFPNFGEGGDTPLGRHRFERMMHEAIERDFNHPSIFAWCLFNETWGFGGQKGIIEQWLAPPPGTDSVEMRPPPKGTVLKRPQVKLPAQGERPGMEPPQLWVQDMWELAKKLDPTRLVEDMSVCNWEHLEYCLHCDTDINSWHFYIDDYQKAKEHIDKVTGSTFVGSTYNYVPGFLHKGQPLINSEYGGIGALDGDRDVSWSFKFLTNELRRHQQIAAYIYTELHDVEWEYNGFLNYDRTPKEFGYDPRFVNESNALPIDSPPIQRVKPGELIRLQVDSSHYSTTQYRNVSLHWEMGGVDTRGRWIQDLARGRVAIPFPHRKVAPAHLLEFKMPGNTLLCTLMLSARTAEGRVLAQNYLYYLVSSGYPVRREDIDRALIVRGAPAEWAGSEWSRGTSSREQQSHDDLCYGLGHGFFEWVMPVSAEEVGHARRIKVLCEASSHRADCPQTDADVFPTTVAVTLNDVPVYQGVLRNHPHDSRGALSYLRGGVGAYGYLLKGFAEGDMIRHMAANSREQGLRLRFVVPAEALAIGGLTIYGAECGRFPVCPTVILEW